MRLSIKSNIKEISKQFDPKDIGNDLGKAVYFSLNRAIKAAKTQATKDVARANGLPVKMTGKKIVRFIQRKDGATKNKDSAKLFVVLNPVPVRRIGEAVANETGVVVRSRTYRGAFVGLMRRKYKNVFQRTGPARFPIKTVTKPLNSATKPLIQSSVQERGVEMFNKRLPHELQRLIEKRKAKT